MIFYLKHRWWSALLVTGLWGIVGVLLAVEPIVVHIPPHIGWQVGVGIAGGVLALSIDGLLHGGLHRALGRRYSAAFREYGREIVNGMRWPEFLAAGTMAALAEEPLFRGLVLGRFHCPAAGIAVSAGLFALCHWVRPRYVGFWLWALWEGVWFGLLAVGTGSLLVPMVAHGLHDAVAYPVLRSQVVSWHAPEPGSADG